MKRICIHTDAHFCQYSSIVRKEAGKYSQRLKGLINSVNWVEKTAVEKGCDTIICLGDFFDKPRLNAAELSALQDIQWCSLPHYFLVGNHEMAESSLEISSAHVLNLIPNVTVVEHVELYKDNSTNADIIFLPYILEENRYKISEYCEQLNSTNRRHRLILSHNDILGIQFGAYKSQSGFEIEDIKSNCTLFINGHIHNGSWIEPNQILNLGNLTGQNFSEDALKYPHQIMILNIPESPDEDFTWEFYQNPYAFNFYKLGAITKPEDFPRFLNNAVISCSCSDKNITAIREFLKNQPNVLEFRTILDQSLSQTLPDEIEQKKLQAVDHLALFQQKIMEMFGTDEIAMSELERVLS